MNLHDFNLMYGINVNFLEYNGLIAAIREWLKNKNMVPLSKVCMPYITQKICSLLSAKKSRDLYKILKDNTIEPLCKTSWSRLLNYNLGDLEWETIFSLPFNITKNTKLQWFQFRINHRILATNSFLHKIKKVDSYNCSFCEKEIETIEHIFWECEFIQDLLNDFATYCFRNILTYVVFVEKEFILGSYENLDQVKYIIALQIKYYIYSMRCCSKKPSLNGLISSIKIMYDTNRYIACKNNRQVLFDEAWENWKNLFNI